LRICGSKFWPKATFTVAWGNAPGRNGNIGSLAEGHIHRVLSALVNMAFGQKDRMTTRSWGYGGKRPSAKHGRRPEAQLRGLRFGACSPPRMNAPAGTRSVRLAARLR
jgi:hypothetical protein